MLHRRWITEGYYTWAFGPSDYLQSSAYLSSK